MTTDTYSQRLVTLMSPASADAFNAASRERRFGGRDLARFGVRLFAHQNGICVRCGNAILHPVDGDVSHSVPSEWHRGDSATRVRGGYLPGNLSLWHRVCNSTFGDRVATPDVLRRPDLIPLDWTTLPRYADPGPHPFVADLP